MRMRVQAADGIQQIIPVLLPVKAETVSLIWFRRERAVVIPILDAAIILNANNEVNRLLAVSDESSHSSPGNKNY